MDAVLENLRDKMPMATALHQTLAYIFNPQTLDAIYDENRGRCYNREITFDNFVKLTAEALLQHGGSANRIYTLAQQNDREMPASAKSFYSKLKNMPIEVSRAMLRQCTRELTGLAAQPAATLPACFDAFEPVIIDGKTIKNVAKRLLNTRAFAGKLLGAKALVALQLSTGMAVAMSDSLDGEANDIPLVPELLPQVRQMIDKPILWLADRQFVDRHTFDLMLFRPGDAFAVRLRKGLVFTRDPDVQVIETTDSEQRRIIDETGTLFTGKSAMRVRLVTLERVDDDDVVVATNLLDRAQYPAAEMVGLYRKRWCIEEVFQKVTQTFSLSHLIGCKPKAVLFQFSMCLLMYNLIQLLRGYMGAQGAVATGDVSTFEIFHTAKRQLVTWHTLEVSTDRESLEVPRGLASMRQTLKRIFQGLWHETYLSKKDKKPRKKRQRAKVRKGGGHTSIQRLLEAAAGSSP